MKEAIPVTQQHFTSAVEAKTWCPLQRALTREYPEAVLGYNNLWLQRNEFSDFYRIAPEIGVWLKRFDLTGKGEPFILILDHKAKTAEMMEEA